MNGEYILILKHVVLNQHQCSHLHLLLAIPTEQASTQVNRRLVGQAFAQAEVVDQIFGSKGKSNVSEIDADFGSNLPFQLLHCFVFANTDCHCFIASYEQVKFVCVSDWLSLKRLNQFDHRPVTSRPASLD